MAEISVVMSLEEAKAVQGLLNVARAQSQTEAGFNKIGAASRAAAKETEQMARQAARVMADLETPLDRHKRKLEELQRLHERGLLSAGQYQRARSMEVERYSAPQREAEAMAARERHLGRLNQLNQVSAAYQSQLAAKLPETFGDKALANLQSYVTGVVGVVAVLGTAKRALDDLEQRRAEAGAEQRQTRMPMAQLKQISETQEAYAENVGKAKRLYERGGASSMTEAYQMVFDAMSAGQEDQLDFIADLRRTGLVKDTAKMSGAIQALQTSMGRKETGNMRDLLNKAVIAGGPAKASADEVLMASARAGATAAGLGVKDEELLAMTGVLTKATTDPMEAGTMMASLMRSLAEMQAKPELQAKLKGKSVMEQLKAIEGMGLSQAQKQELFGRHEALTAAQILGTNRAETEELARKVDEAQRTDIVGQRMGFIAPGEAAALAADRAKARENLSAEQLGEQENWKEAARLNWIASQRESTGGGLNPLVEIQTLKGRAMNWAANWASMGSWGFRSPHLIQAAMGPLGWAMSAGDITTDIIAAGQSAASGQSQSRGFVQLATEQTLLKILGTSETANRQRRTSGSGATNTHTE